jgi:hypothetical protein
LSVVGNECLEGGVCGRVGGAMVRLMTG